MRDSTRGISINQLGWGGVNGEGVTPLWDESGTAVVGKREISIRRTCEELVAGVSQCLFPSRPVALLAVCPSVPCRGMRRSLKDNEYQKGFQCGEMFARACFAWQRGIGGET